MDRKQDVSEMQEDVLPFETRKAITIGLLGGIDIRKYREHHDMSRSYFGDKLGVSVGTVRSWEIGEFCPCAESVAAIRALFSVYPAPPPGHKNAYRPANREPRGMKATMVKKESIMDVASDWPGEPRLSELIKKRDRLNKAIEAMQRIEELLV